MLPTKVLQASPGNDSVKEITFEAVSNIMSYVDSRGGNGEGKLDLESFGGSVEDKKRRNTQVAFGAKHTNKFQMDKSEKS